MNEAKRVAYVAALLVGFILAVSGCATYTEADVTHAYKEGFAVGLSTCRKEEVSKAPRLCVDPKGRTGCVY